MITRKERTSREIEQWMLENGAEASAVPGVLARLKDLRLLDDERFAWLYAEDKRERSGWGAERIEQALLDRGIEYGLACAAAAAPAEEEVERAVGILRERGFELEDPADRQRALGLVARRGFSAEVAYDAIRRARRDRPASPTDHSSLGQGQSSEAASSR